MMAHSERPDGKPTASVCIVTYNSEKDIEDCLHAVLKQSFPVRDAIVVDNASADRTRDIVAAFPAPVRLIANAVNNGFAGGQNQAIAQTDSDYVLVLNPDVTLAPDYIAELVAFMERQPDVGSATGRLVSAHDPERMDSAGLAMRAGRQAYDLAAGEPASAWDKPLRVFGVSGAAAMYRRRMIDDISFESEFFDEDFFAYKEDVDAAWRAGHLGWTAWYVPAARALHGRGWKQGGRRAMPAFVRRHSYQNRIFTLIKNEPPGWHWLKLAPLLLALEGAKLGYILLRERELLACWTTIIRLWPRMRRKRRWLFQKKLTKSSA